MQRGHDGSSDTPSGSSFRGIPPPPFPGYRRITAGEGRSFHLLLALVVCVDEMFVRNKAIFIYWCFRPYFFVKICFFVCIFELHRGRKKEKLCGQTGGVEERQMTALFLLLERCI